MNNNVTKENIKSSEERIRGGEPLLGSEKSIDIDHPSVNKSLKDSSNKAKLRQDVCNQNIPSDNENKQCSHTLRKFLRKVDQNMFRPLSKLVRRKKKS